VEWKCTKSIEEWVGTNISFDMEDRNGRALLCFAHSGWEAATDTFAACNYGWGRFMTQFKTIL
jgi:hypothetical protein